MPITEERKALDGRSDVSSPIDQAWAPRHEYNDSAQFQQWNNVSYGFGPPSGHHVHHQPGSNHHPINLQGGAQGKDDSIHVVQDRATCSSDPTSPVVDGYNRPNSLAYPEQTHDGSGWEQKDEISVASDLIGTRTSNHGDPSGFQYLEDRNSTPGYSEKLGGGTTNAKDEALPANTLPDWTPKSLSLIPSIMILIVCMAAIYIALNRMSTHNGIICPESSGADKVFIHGPTLLGLLLAEVLTRVTIDIESVIPFQKLTQDGGSKADNDMLAEPLEQSLWETIISLPMSQVFGKRKAKWMRLLIYGINFVLIPTIASTLNSGDRSMGSSSADFNVMNFDGLLSGLNTSMIPSIWFPPFINTTSYSSYSDLRWLESKSVTSPVSASLVGILPFAPEADRSGLGGTEIWKVQTSAMYGELECAPISATVSVSNLDVVEGGNVAISGMSLDLVDGNDCHVSSQWNGLSTNKSPSISNPLAMDEASKSAVFALWGAQESASTGLSAMPPNTTVKGCSSFQHFIVFGPLPGASHNGSVNTEPGSGWGAIGCKTAYYQRDHQTSVNSSSVSGSFLNGKSVDSSGFTKMPYEQSSVIDTMMLRNFLNNSLIYSIPDVVQLTGATFWLRLGNAPIVQALGDFAGSVDDLNCTGVSSTIATTSSWTVKEDCQSYIVIASIWSLLVASIPLTTAPFATADKWVTVQGSIDSHGTGWYVTDGGMGIALFLLLGVLVALVWEYVRHVRRRTLWYGRVVPKTGLYGSPFGINNLAFTSQDRGFRRLFTGVDVVGRKAANQRIMTTLTSTPLQLRRWQRVTYTTGSTLTTTSSGPTSAYIKIPGPDNATPSEGDAVFDCDEEQITDLRYGPVPWVLKWWFVFACSAVSLAIVVTVIAYIAIPHRTTFRLWRQLSGRTSFEQWAQKFIFTAAPTLFFVLLAIAWDEVDAYFRRTQPFASLADARGELGSRSIGLNYVHDFHGIVTYRALKNGHWILGLVTLMTLVGKVGVFMAAGVFRMTDQPWTVPETLNYTSRWRSNSFPTDDLSGDAFPNAFRQRFLSLLVFDWAEMPGWKVGDYQFPSLWPTDPIYSMSLDGFRGNLTCTPSTASLEPSPDSDTWIAKLDGGECAGAIWQGALATQPETSESSLTSASMAWMFLNQSSCPGISSDESGRWWILDMIATRIQSRPSADHAVRLSCLDPSCGKEYSVKANDTCASIADNHTLHLNQIKLLNPCLDATCLIHPNDTLCVGLGSSENPPDGWNDTSYNPFTNPNSTTGGGGSNDVRTSITSMLCTPAFFMDTLNVTVHTIGSIFDEDSPTVTVTRDNLVTSRAVKSEAWVAEGSNMDEFTAQYGKGSSDLGTFISTFLNSSLLSGTLHPISNGVSLDYLSMMAVTLSQNTTTNLDTSSSTQAWNLNPSSLSLLASRTFALATSVFINLDLNLTRPYGHSPAQTVLLTPDSTNTTHLAAYPWINKAEVQYGSLYVCTGIVGLYLLTVPLLWILSARKTSPWRPPRDVAYAANVISMFYDSSLVDYIAAEGPPGNGHRGRPEVSWENMRWGLGVFRSPRSGALRIGIEQIARLAVANQAARQPEAG